MRLIGAISLLLFLCPGIARAGDVLVATRRLELRTHAITLSERVSALVARERLSRMQLLAPVAGVVSHTYVEPGEFAQPATPVAALVSLDVVRLEIGVPGYEVHRIDVGTGNAT